MSNSYRSVVLVSAVLAGCQVDSLPPHLLDQLHDRVVTEARPATQASATLGLMVHPRRGQAGRYGLAYLRELDWQVAAATLTNTLDPTIPTLTRSAVAVVGADNVRTAALQFSPIKAAAGYTLSLALTKKNADGSGTGSLTVASGTATNVTLVAGTNNVTVTLTPTPSGDLLVDLSTPSVTLNSVTTSISTQSHYDVTRIAGTAAGGNSLGTSPDTAAFREIAGIDLDASGAIYVADAGNNQLRKVPSAGGSVLIAGAASGTPGFSGDGGPASAALLASPRGVARDPSSGNLAFCDAGNNVVRTVGSADGAIYTIAGGGADASATVSYAVNAQLKQPFGIAADTAGTLFVTERTRGRIVRVTAAGALNTVATLGTGTLGPLAIDRTHHVLWVGNGGTVSAVTTIDGDGSTPALTPTVTPVYTALGSGAPVITGLAFDQVGTLFVMQAGTASVLGDTSVQILRLPVTSTGLLQPSRKAEAIAGTGLSGATPALYVVPNVTVPNALNQLLAGASWCGLAIDTTAGLSTTQVCALYAGNSYSGQWSHVVRLGPAALVP